MRAEVLYEHRIEITKEDGSIIELPMKGQIVEVIGTLEGGNHHICRTIGFPWVGTFTISRDNLRFLD